MAHAGRKTAVDKDGGKLQAQGTAIWLFAYVGYWLQILVVLVIKFFTGTLLVAGVKRGQLKRGPKKAPGMSHAGDSAKTEKGGQYPEGKDVEPADFIVNHHTPVQDGKGVKEGYEEAEGSGSSGSDTQHTNPQHVQLADLQQSRG